MVINKGVCLLVMVFTTFSPGFVLSPVGEGIKSGGNMVSPVGESAKPDGKVVSLVGESAKPVGNMVSPVGDGVKSVGKVVSPVGDGVKSVVLPVETDFVVMKARVLCVMYWIFVIKRIAFSHKYL